jgi:hypothetical protein
MIILRKLIYPQAKMANLFSFSLPFDIRRLKITINPNKSTKLSAIIQIMISVVI